MALGRGLGELLGEVTTAYENSTGSSSIVLLDTDLIDPNPDQPRKVFDPNKLEELSKSIIEYGLIQPICVIKSDNDRYTLISGERRLRAHKLGKMDKIQAIIMSLEELKLRELALIENIQRDDLNVIELAYSYAKLINEHHLTHDELSEKVFKSRSSITNTLRLLSLSVYVQQLLSSDKITAGHAKILIGFTEEEQKTIVDSIIGQKLSVRETEQLVKNLKHTTTSPKKKVIQESINTEPLLRVVETIESRNLNVKLNRNNLTIKINSQDDVEKILRYFTSNP